MSKKTKIITWVIIGIVAVVLIAILMSDIFGAKELAFNEFETLLKGGNIKTLYIDAYNLTGVTTEGEQISTVAPRV
ncbi:MAG: ATP-dependent metallopeptidase FtsH/Yme1/Tma family protein, partial [Clostridia bacterium]|nr:ATP-dependent metallopeptidase FtsH/Yme1/Tma family protein [Clostridia bacterium]